MDADLTDLIVGDGTTTFGAVGEIKDTLIGVGTPLVGLGVFWFGLRWILSVARRGGRA